MKNNEETSRAGSKWLQEEDDLLLQEIIHKTYDEIALNHKRTVTGIKSRVISHVIYPIYKKGNKNINELSNEYNIDKETIEKYINKIDKKQESKESTENNNINNLILLKLSSLEYKLVMLEHKINYIINPNKKNDFCI